MPLSAGSRVGPYEVVSLLGAGGMGEVYRAHDARLGRDVAIKVLPPSVATDPERLRRFEQEARAAAALNHPNILAIHDIGTGDPAYVVTELLEGQTLRELLLGGSVPVRKAVDYAVQIARGLTAAHEKGIVHRDLKPENVFITEDGRAKILDFGLAKLVERTPSAPGSTFTGPSMLPTEAPGTTPGMILGTVGYMAPEQVRGLAVDHRADLFALGAVLYEMLSGRRAFRGETTADTLTAILKEDPPDLPSTERQIPAGLSRVVDRALEKSPSSRFQSASDLGFALEALSSSRSDSLPAVQTADVAAPRAGLAWTLVGVLSLVALGLATMAYVMSRPTAARIVRAAIPLPDGVAIIGPPPTRFAVSPDGQMVVFVGRGSDGVPQLWLRRLDALTAQPMAGTQNASSPFWSPDSRAIGFFTVTGVKRVDAAGGPVTTIAETSGGTGAAIGGTWNADGVVLFSGVSARGARLYRVSAAGGSAVELDTGEESATLPWFLPDGRRFLYRSGAFSGSSGEEIRVGSLDSDESVVLLKDTSQPKFASGFLLHVRGTTLLAQRLDLDALTLGEAFPLAEDVQTGAGGNSAFSVSQAGVLMFQGGGSLATELTWFDHQGQVLEALFEPDDYGDVALSPDGTRALVTLTDGAGEDRDLWMLDLARRVRTKFTFEVRSETYPVWSADGTRVAYTYLDTSPELMEKPADLTSPERVLFQDEKTNRPLSWAKDGSLLFGSSSVGAIFDLWVLPPGENAKPRAVIESPFNEAGAEFSPNGRWLAYSSNQSGRSDIFVMPFPGPGGKQQVSTAGGVRPRWSRDGTEIFYDRNAGLFATAVEERGGALVIGGERTILPVGTLFTAQRNSYDLAPDGRILVNRNLNQGGDTITLVLNWMQGLELK